MEKALNSINKYKKMIAFIIISILLIAFAIFLGILFYEKTEEGSYSSVFSIFKEKEITTTTTTLNNTKSESDHFILTEQSIGEVIE